MAAPLWLACWTFAACTVLVPRVLIISLLFSPPVARALAPMLVPAFITGSVLVLIGWRAHGNSAPVLANEDENPLRFASALQMAGAFQLAIVAIAFTRDALGAAGIYGMSALLGLTDVDALTVSMSRAADMGPETAARALTTGILANTLLKAVLAASIGSPAFRKTAGVRLIALAAALAAGLLL